jgi:DNA-binding CsgD family transcriptional regulator
MARPDPLQLGREAFARHRWREAYEHLSKADRDEPLDPPHLEQLAIAAYLIGLDAETADLLGRAHQAFLNQRDLARAARCAFWLAFSLLNKGESARAGGWVERARRLLEEEPSDCVERGYGLVPGALRLVGEGNFAGAVAVFAEAAAIGERFGDADLTNLARQGRGRALIRLGETNRGVAILDEVMVAVTAGELSPIFAGVVYCSVISACLDMFDLRRAGEWTEALSQWCAAQPDLVPYRGFCLVHRAEIMQMRGVWPDAIDQARQACTRLAETANRSAAGAALYQLAELHRLRGEVAQAEDAYRLASESGRSPYPGLALLRLDQGRADAAKAAICRTVDEVQPPKLRASVLAAFVEIMLECGDVAAARRGADELSKVAASLDVPFVRAMTAGAMGAVVLAEGDPRGALTWLRLAWGLWNELDVPYEAARVRVNIARACREVGDTEGADMELNAARRVFEQLGAAPELARVARPAASSAPALPGLTARELQVLQLVASGKTNRVIAGQLAISEKTVARHISNIFTKLDLSSRAAATAYAFQHHLV